MILTESNVTIMVKDMNRSIDFYLMMGLTLKQRWENHYAMLTGPGITLGIHPSDGNETSSGSVSIGFMIKQINEAKKLLDDNRVTYRDEDGKSGHYLNFQDPDGTNLYFVLPKW
jgi:catechol 2,3-dioxygenase-like lactoylglutathione lyase family enzyme